MHLVIELSTMSCVLLGIYLLYAGEWEKFHLKRSVVLLSTTAAMGFTYVVFFYPESTICASPDVVCATLGIYCLFKNIAILLFQWACGRDALESRNQERRGMKAWQKMNSYNNRERWRA